MNSLSYLSLIGVSWTLYFVLHSALASMRMKRWATGAAPWLARYYRLLFNIFALLLLLPLGWLNLQWGGPSLWQWTGAGRWLSHLAFLIGVIGFFWSLRYYDGGEILGTRQWLHGRTADVHGDFRLSPLHRFVRHPWYALLLLILWTRDMDAAGLLVTVLINAYLVVGSHLEERKLVMAFGEPYKHYRERVPGLIPRPWKYLSAAEATKIVGR